MYRDNLFNELIVDNFADGGGSGAESRNGKPALQEFDDDGDIPF